jgi:FkbM family methyltransferase
MLYKINDFTVVESVHGRFIVNRHNIMQIESIVKTGYTHMQEEFGIINDLIDVCDDSCIVLDAGANCGIFSIPIAQRIKERGGKVIAFEPQRMMFNALSGSVALNDLRNVFSYQMALSDSNGFVELPEIDYHSETETDFGTVEVSKLEPPYELCFITDRIVKCITIDSMSLHRLDFVKIDVEGFELNVLTGGKKTIQKYRPFFHIEYWKVGMDAIINFFKQNDINDYQFMQVDTLNMICVPQEKINILNDKYGSKV